MDAVDGDQVPAAASTSASSASRRSRRRTSCSRATSIRSRCGRSIPAVNAEAAKLCRDADAIVALGHEGANAGTVTDPTGPLIDIADGVQGVDVVIGDHNDLQVDALRPNGVLVTENRGKGIRFTRVRIVLGPGQGRRRLQDGRLPQAVRHRRHARSGDPGEDRRSERAAGADPRTSRSARRRRRSRAPTSAATRPDGRCESLVGNVVTDAMRTTYSRHRRAVRDHELRRPPRPTLTCPTVDIGGDFCPSFSPPPFPITRGQSLTVLPFGNIVVTLTVNGAELKTMLENGVSRMPAVDGRFPQVSGLCFTYDIAQPAGSRVTGAVLADNARQLHRDADQPDGGRSAVQDRPERLHGERRRRLSELRQPR